MLTPAYAPCVAFRGACHGAEWNPARGRIPRGFVGASRTLRDVRLIILLAEPGGGFDDESYPEAATSEEYIGLAVTTAYEALRDRRSTFHANLRFVLDQCWPDETLDEQLAHTWITETYLCSARQTAGPVPPLAQQACAETYLTRQLKLLPGHPIIALGGKATRRTGRHASVISAYAVGLPGANSPRARPSWIAAAARARQLLELTTREDPPIPTRMATAVSASASDLSGAESATRVPRRRTGDRHMSQLWISRYIDQLLSTPPAGTQTRPARNGVYPGVRISGCEIPLELYAHDDYIRVGIRSTDPRVFESLKGIPGFDVVRAAKAWFTGYIRNPEGTVAIDRIVRSRH